MAQTSKSTQSKSTLFNDTVIAHEKTGRDNNAIQPSKPFVSKEMHLAVNEIIEFLNDTKKNPVPIFQIFASKLREIVEEEENKWKNQALKKQIRNEIGGVDYFRTMGLFLILLQESGYAPNDINPIGKDEYVYIIVRNILSSVVIDYKKKKKEYNDEEEKALQKIKKMLDDAMISKKVREQEETDDISEFFVRSNLPRDAEGYPVNKGGGKKKSQKSKWVSTGLQTKCKDGVTRTLWRNNVTGDARVKRITRHNGNVVASYVKP
jgi:hypothetical protein